MKNKHPHKEKIAVGIIRIHSRGFGFVIPDDRALFPEDIFIPRHATKGAVDGDHVEAVVSPFVSEKGPEGKVKKILTRGRSHLAGVISFVGKKGQIYAYAPLLGEDQSMRILPSEEKTLNLGDRIIIHVLDWGSKQREPLGEMSAYIGHISDPTCDIIAAIEEFDLESDFPESVLDEAKSFGRQVTLKDLHDREDHRSLDCFTIDPDTAKDFDDALSLSIDKKGHFHLGVHIADVSYYVKAGSALDRQARERCNSVYFPGAVLPMLPHELSSHLCSLKPNVNRLAISIFMTLDSSGNLINYRICKSVIRSKKRFTYREAKELLDGVKKSPLTSTLQEMVNLCLILKKKRASRGSIEFSLPDLFIEIDESGTIKNFEIIEYDITHQLVEEFMLLANEVVATDLSQKGKPLTYRIHEEPNPENIRDFALTASMIGFPLPATPTAEELQNLFKMAQSTTFGRFLATAFIRSMKLASYSTENIGHYGLGLEYYTHFTSPIRRYIDLLVHRVLFNEIDASEELEKLALRCSEKERLSAKAESSVIFLKKLRYFENELRRGNVDFEATVVAIKNFGIIFEIHELLYEGLIPVAEKEFKIGQKIKIRLQEVDLITRRIDWTLLFMPHRKVRHKKGGKKRK